MPPPPNSGERTSLLNPGNPGGAPGSAESPVPVSVGQPSSEAMSEPYAEYSVNRQFWRRAAKISSLVLDEVGTIRYTGCMPRFGHPLGRAFYLQTLLYITSITIVILLVIPSASDILGSLVRSNTDSRHQKEAHVFGDGMAFYKLLIGLFLAVLPMAAGIFIGQYIVILSRQILQRRFHRMIFNNKALYELVVVDKRIDNYDQRITDDLQLFLQGFLGAIIGNFNCFIPMLFTVIQAMAGLFALIHLGGDTTGWTVLTCVIVLLLLGAGVLFTINRLCNLQFSQQLRDGDLRFAHSRAVAHSESIAFYGGEQREFNECNSRFSRAVVNFRELIVWQSLIYGLLQGFTYLTTPLALLLLYQWQAIRHSCTESFKDMFEAFQLIQLSITSFYNLPAVYSSLTQIAGVTHRVGELIEVLEELEADLILRQFSQQVQVLEESSAAPALIELRDVTAGPPGTALHLFNRLNLVVREGESVVVQGPSGCGKSSLLRVISGLWEVDDGTVIKPQTIGRGGIFFVPQRSYIAFGGLRDQVTYPQTIKYETGNSDPDVLAILELVKLDYLVARWGLDTPADWSGLLSGGEKQRLGLARLFYHAPKFAVLDESTSALDVPMESRILKSCLDRGMTLISVAHRSSAVPIHKHIFRYNPSTKDWTQHEVPASDHEAAIKQGAEQQQKYAEKTESDPNDVRATDSAEVPRLKEAPRSGMWDAIPRLWKFIKLSSQEIKRPLAEQCFVRLIAASLLVTICYFIGEAFERIALQSSCSSSAVSYGALAVVAAIGWGVCDGVGAWYAYTLAIGVRKAVVDHMHRLYFRPKVIYATNHISRLDTVDQRFVQDTVGMTQFLAIVLFGSGPGVGMVGLFVFIVVCSIAGMVFFSWFVTLSVLLYFTLAYLSVLPVQNRVTGNQMGVQYSEGTLRFFHARVRLFTESIEFYQGEAVELQNADMLLDGVVDAYIEWVWSAVPLMLVLVAQVLLGTQIALIILCVMQFYMDSISISDKDSVITATFIFFTLFSNMLGVLGVYFGLTAFLAGYVNRVAQLEETIAQYEHYGNNNEARIQNCDTVQLHDLTVETPGGDKCLVRGLSISVEHGASLVIMGESGAGKSSLLRVVAGLWGPTSGFVSRPLVGQSLTGVLFMPQTSYTTIGTLRDQIVYPHQSTVRGAQGDNRLLLELLEVVQLRYLAERWGLDTVVIWDDQLSGGEAQRLGFARLFYHNPRYAIMDEATSAMDDDLQHKMMSECLNRSITIISVAHRPQVIAYHENILRLTGDGSFELVATSASNEKLPLISFEKKILNQSTEALVGVALPFMKSMDDLKEDKL